MPHIRQSKAHIRQSKMAHIRQSKPDSGLGVQVKVLNLSSCALFAGTRRLLPPARASRAAGTAPERKGNNLKRFVDFHLKMAQAGTAASEHS